MSIVDTATFGRAEMWIWLGASVDADRVFGSPTMPHYRRRVDQVRSLWSK